MNVPRHAKDILLKHLSRAFPDDALAALGISGIAVERAVPTELPVLEIRQGFTDVVFALRDDSLLHLEFQSSREAALDRFLAYDTQLYCQWHRRIRTIILYIGVDRPPVAALDAGAIVYQVESIPLRQMDGDAILAIVEHHLRTGQWDRQDRIRLAFALHMHFHIPEDAFSAVLRLTQAIPDPEEQNYVTALILGLSGPQLSAIQTQRIKEALRMNEVLRELGREAEQRGREEGMHGKAVVVARRLLALGMSEEDVAAITDLPRTEIANLRG